MASPPKELPSLDAEGVSPDNKKASNIALKGFRRRGAMKSRASAHGFHYPNVTLVMVLVTTCSKIETTMPLTQPITPASKIHQRNFLPSDYYPSASARFFDLENGGT